MTVPHAALAPSGQPIWHDMARRSARALVALSQAGRTLGDILTRPSISNAMVVHAAFGGSTNLILHIPAIAFAAGLPRPTVDDWHAINAKVPRLVSVLPNGPFYHPTVRAFLAGRRSGGHAPPPGARLARPVRPHRDRRAAGTVARLVGGERAPEATAGPAARAGWRRPRRRDHEPGPCARAGADQHRDVPARQPGARGLGHQEHGHRPDAW